MPLSVSPLKRKGLNSFGRWDVKMDATTKINQYRERLDKTLSCSDLVNENAIRKNAKSRLLQSAEYETEGDIGNLLEKTTDELVDFLGMLRSASLSDDKNTNPSGASNAEWKLKQDTEECRVMYREGPPGTPFHVLLVEGYLDGPVDAGLCVAWETTLYKKWWPQFNYPAFKVTSSQCVRQIGIGDQICTVRMKVPWPLSAREALLHYHEFEFFQEDLVVVIIKTIDDVERDGCFYGITNDLIPESNNAVKIGVVGGLAIQKVNNERCYFRLIASMDMKLDFVSPSLINFIARQLIGNGFKLCQKAVASISKGNKDFSNSLEGPMYNRIRQAIHLPVGVKVPEPEIIKTDEVKSTLKDRDHDLIDTSLTNPPQKSPHENSPDVDVNIEIREEDSLAESSKFTNNADFNRKRFRPRHEVEHALGTLDKIIKAVRKHHMVENVSSNAHKRCLENVQHKPPESDTNKSTTLGDMKSELFAGEVETSMQISTERHQLTLQSSTCDIATEAVHKGNTANNIAAVSPRVNGNREENVKVGKHKNLNTICFCWPCNFLHR